MSEPDSTTDTDAPILPFTTYPDGGRTRLGIVGGSNCRRGYGLKFMINTGQTCCAYCGLDFAASYENWLQMALDHVVPTKTGTAKCIPHDWLDDCTNKVLACSTCNGFQNRYKLPVELICPASLEEFYDLRDNVFLERKSFVLASRAKDREFFNGKPWII